jgi:hypothetical protein
VTAEADISERVPCDCGLVSHRAAIWREVATVWGWPDFLAEHSPEACTRPAWAGKVLHGPPMRVSVSRARRDEGASRP